MDLQRILGDAVRRDASDVHLSPNRPPLARIQGRMGPLEGYPVLDGPACQRLIFDILQEEQKARFSERWELDLSFTVPGLTRFRVNVYRSHEGVSAALRVISGIIPQARHIGLPEQVLRLARLPRGLVLVTGPTGAGKSTTLACLIDEVNRTRYDHILTIEDPIEFLYQDGNCLVSQREVGRETLSFSSALRSALRQDPDVILVGEMRDLETIALTITAAETGHLVFSTLHTTDAAQTVDRMVDVFPPQQQQQIRIQLAATLKAVICQQILPRADGRGRVVAREIMYVTPAVANMIREGKTHQFYHAIETGADVGMVPLDRALAHLVLTGVVRVEDARARCNDPEELGRYLQGG